MKKFAICLVLLTLGSMTFAGCAQEAKKPATTAPAADKDTTPAADAPAADAPAADTSGE